MKVVMIVPRFTQDMKRLQPYRTLLEMGRQLQMRGHVFVLLSDGGSINNSDEKQIDDLRWRCSSSVHLFRRGSNPQLQMLIQEEAPDLILWHLSMLSFVHQRFDLPFSAPVIGILTSPIHRPSQILRIGLKKLSTNLDLALMHTLAAIVPSALVRRAFQANGLRGMITLSKKTSAFLAAKGVSADKIWVVPPGVSHDWLEARIEGPERQKHRASLGYKDQDVVITYFGSPAPVRGVLTMLKAFRQASSTHPQLKLLILSRQKAGEWERESAWLHRQVRQYGLQDRVQIIEGYLAQAQLISYVAAGDVVCLPFELVPSDMPLSVYEAMALQRGVITTTIASLTEMVSEARGFLLPPGSYQTLATHFKALAVEPHIAVERGKHARAYIETHRTWSTMGGKLTSALEDILYD